MLTNPLKRLKSDGHNIPDIYIVILIAGIFPRASSNGAHGSQSNDSTSPCAVVFTSPLTSRLCSQLQELQELPTSPLRMWSSSKKHHLLLTWAPGPGVEPGSRGHKADAVENSQIIKWGIPALRAACSPLIPW